METKKKTLIWIFGAIFFFLLFFFGIIFGMIGCEHYLIKKAYQQESYGDFLYDVKKDDDNNKYVRIMGLTDIGKEKEIIVVPEYINGIRVKKIGLDGMVLNHGTWSSNTLKKVYINFSVELSSDVFGKCENLESVILFFAYTKNNRIKSYNF